MKLNFSKNFVTAVSVAFVIIFFSTNDLFAQVGYVNAANKVYFFLERMSAEGIISNYDSFELPKKRTEVAKYLLELKSKRNSLNSVDAEKLDYFLTEFDFEINGSTERYSSLYNDSFSYLTNDKPKYLFFSADTGTGSAFVNFIGSGDFIYKDAESSGSVFPFIFGGKIRLTFGKYFGGEIFATNGSYFGTRELLYDEAPFKYNYKFTESENDNVGSEYFDETAGYFTAQTRYADFKIGRDRLNFGYGIFKTLFGNNAPNFDYLSLNLRYKRFRFSFLHGKLLGKSQIINEDNLSRRFLNDKWIAYHRFAFDISRGTQIGAGETVVYYGRSLDLSYLNPFNFYKSAEHANQDRDNSMLFFDFRTVDFIKRAEVYFTFYIDDIDFTKLGTGWYGNNFLWDFGFSYALKFLPSDLFSFQAVAVNPYFYTHKFYDNNFTNRGYNIADDIEPNSLYLIFRYAFSLSRDLDFSFSYLYKKHGANLADENGNVITNYGGDLLVGHREGDSEYVSFLDGVQETRHAFEMEMRYEFIRGYNFNVKCLYRSENSSDVFSLYSGIEMIF
jgi:hypothetical protein